MIIYIYIYCWCIPPIKMVNMGMVYGIVLKTLLLLVGGLEHVLYDFPDIGNNHPN